MVNSDQLPIPSLVEPDIILRAKNGDQRAIGRLVARFTDRIAAFARRSGASETEAEEITSQTLEQMIRHIGQYQGRSSFASWVLTIARNRLRRLRRQKADSDCVPLDEVYSIPGSSALQPEELARRDREKRLCAGYLARLTPGQREVIQSVWLDGLTLTETARLTGKSLANLSNTLRRGIERLQQLAAQPATRARIQTESIHDQEETKTPA